jgi:hypothetical protein
VTIECGRSGGGAAEAEEVPDDDSDAELGVSCEPALVSAVTETDWVDPRGVDGEAVPVPELGYDPACCVRAQGTDRHETPIDRFLMLSLALDFLQAQKQYKVACVPKEH